MNNHSETKNSDHNSVHIDADTIPGWDEELELAFSAYKGTYTPGRVASRHKTVCEILIPGAVLQAGISGALQRIGKQPVVGDFVVLLDQPETGSRMVVNILPRRTCLSRGAAGDGGGEQVIAANLDTIFIVTSVGKDLNLRRLERYLAIVYSSEANPVILLNKIDLADDPARLVEKIRAVAGAVPVIPLSALSKTGLDALSPYLNPGETVALVGSSGVGKSTLINSLLGETVQRTEGIREDDEKGRHTTTVRQMFLLPNGAVLIDNPGIREIQLGDSAEGLEKAFSEIVDAAHNCKFKDCTHRDEPGCAVLQAVKDGLIPEERLESYHRLADELVFQSKKSEMGLKRLEKEKYREIAVTSKKYRKFTGKP
ncbi:putative GTPase related to EngC [Methanosarcina siciliae C2J]|uniref:Small ribosomal subunit biogenesis GTPase RsgA n=1 Tax=Methanosarcina siciliae C2J TaxID=1434118 RepID=A0A0E3PNN1_9EURY|nr:ribosome small subunit-dependent GTPase A [Methanosarcina siciliae]AKB36097.1 putative GTPase related to EngC [Methanosarcina siciliae C2J]